MKHKNFILYLVGLLAFAVCAVGAAFGFGLAENPVYLNLAVDWFDGFTGHVDGIALASVAAAVPEGAKQLVDQIKGEWEQIKQKNEEQLTRFGEKTGELSEHKEFWEKANQRLDALETKAGRVVGNPEGGQAYTNADQKAYGVAYAKYLRRGEETGLAELEQKALSVNSDPDGGYTVSPFMANTIVRTVFETSPLRQYASSVTLDNGVPYEELVDNDEASTGWVTEEESRTETDSPQLAKLRIPQHEQYAKPKVTQRLLDSSSLNIEEWLGGKVADKMARTETTAFFSGNGTSQPRGLLTYAAGTSWGQIQQVASGAAAAVTADGIMDLVASMKTPYLRGSVLMMRRASIWAVRKLRADAVSAADGAGGYLWQPSLEAGIAGTLLGYPVVEAADMPAIQASALPVVFANFREAYMIVDGNVMRTLRDPYSSKPYVEFYTTKFVGGGVRNFEAIKLQVVST